MRLKELQKRTGKTIKETANELNIAVSTYNNYLRGTREPDIKMIKKIADYFSVSTDYLLEHDSMQKLDLTPLTQNQICAIKIILELNSRNCVRALAYVQGLKDTQEEQRELIKKLQELE